MEPMTITTFGIGLDPKIDIVAIDMFANRHNRMTRSEAIRFLIRTHARGPSPHIHNYPDIPPNVRIKPTTRNTVYDGASMAIIEHVMLIVGIPHDMIVNELIHIAGKRMKNKEAIPFHPNPPPDGES
jgi:hypothetical protein